MNSFLCGKLISSGSGSQWVTQYSIGVTSLYPLFRGGEVVDFTDQPVSSPFLLRISEVPQAVIWAAISNQYPFYNVINRVANAPVKARVVPRVKLKDLSLSDQVAAAGSEYELARVVVTDTVSSTTFAPCQYQPRNYYYEKLVDTGLLRLVVSFNIPTRKPPIGDFTFSKAAEGDLAIPDSSAEFVPSDYIDIQGLYFDANKTDEIWIQGKDRRFHHMSLESSYSGEFLLSLFSNGYTTQKIERGKFYVLDSANIDENAKVNAYGKVFYRGSIKVKR